MEGFASVLRGLGSVLNPDVNAQANADYQARREFSRNMQLALLNKAVEGVQTGAVDPSVLPPALRQIVGVSPEAQQRQVALRKSAAREKFFQSPQVQEALTKGDNASLTQVFRAYVGTGLADNPFQAAEEIRKLATSGQRVLAPGASLVDENGNIVTTAPDKSKPLKTEWISLPGNKKQQAVLDENSNIVRMLGAPMDAHSPPAVNNIYSGSLVPGVDRNTGESVFVQPSPRGDTPPRVLRDVVPPERPGESRERQAAAADEATVQSVRARINQMLNRLQQERFVTGPAGMVRRGVEAGVGVAVPDVATPAIDQQNDIRLLLADIRKIVEKDPNLSNEERRNLYETLGGGIFQTPGSAVRALNNVVGYIENKKLSGPSRNSPAARRDSAGFEVNRVYTDAQGNKAKYLGNGRWEELR